MANTFKAKTLVGKTGIFSEQILAPNIIYNTGDQSVDGIKDFNNQINVSGIKFDLITGNDIPPAYQDGLMWYDDDAKALKFYNDVTSPLTIGQEQIVRGVNNLGFTLSKGQVVYITGAAAGGGDKFPGFQLSIAGGEGHSARTLGIIAEDISDNNKGYAISFGRLEGIDTNAYNVGQTLYLSWTTSGAFTGVKPKAPNHLVRVGTVLRKGNVGNGVIFVTVQNGFELDELHDVNINGTNTLNNGDTIRYNSSSGIWFNEPINTGIFQDQINSLSGAAVLIYGDQIITGTKYFYGQVYTNNLYVTGTEFITNVQNNFVQSPYIILNLTGGALDGGMFFVTGTGLTGVNDSGPIIGFDHSNKFKFGISTRNSDLSTLNDIAAFQDITAYSGFVNNKYATIINLASTGSTLQNQIDNLGNTYATVTNLASTGLTLDTKINSLSGSAVLLYNNQTINGTKTFNSGVVINVQPTGTNPALYITGTWNNANEIYSGIAVDITDNNSLSGRLIDLKTSGISRLSLRRNTTAGNETSPWRLVIGDNEFGGGTRGGVSLGWSEANVAASLRNRDNTADINLKAAAFNASTLVSASMYMTVGSDLELGSDSWRGKNRAVNLTNDAGISWSSTNAPGGTLDLNILRDGGGILAQRNGTNAQQFRVYNSTGTNSGEFGLFGWQNNQLVIGSQATNSGALRNTILTGVTNIFGPPSQSINITASNSGAPGFFNAITPNNINLTAGTGIAAFTNASAYGTIGLVGNIDINNISSPLVPKSINIYRTGISNMGLPGVYSAITIDNNNISINNPPTSSPSNNFGLVISGNLVTPNLYVNTTSNQIINGLKTFTSGIDIYSGTSPQSIRVFNRTGTNSGEFGLFGWQNNNLIIGAQQSQSGILRDVILTGRNININASGVFNIFDNTNIVGNLDVTGNILLSGNSVLTGISNIVFTTGDQNIAGNKNFAGNIDISGRSFNLNSFVALGAAVTITQPDYAESQVIDYIENDLAITRGTYGGPYNPIEEGEWNGMGPTYTTWNAEGWSNLINVKSRTYYAGMQAAMNNNFVGITGYYFIMYDTQNDKYYKLKFNSWQVGAGNEPGYKGFSYTRELIIFNESEINGSNVGGNLDLKNRLSINGTGVLLSGEAGQVPDTVVQTSGTQTISGSKTFSAATTFSAPVSVTSNLTVSQTGNFGDMNISVDEMSVSGLHLTISSGNLILASPSGVPSTTGSAGIKGSIVWDTGYLYVCVNNNSWRRATLNTW